MKRVLLKVYYKFLGLKDRTTIFYNKIITSKKKTPIVINIDKTIEKIINDECSVSRYGDGEFGLMQGRNLIFQPYSEEIGNRLKEIIKSNNPSHIVCIPDIFNDLNRFKDKPKKYWERYVNLNRDKIYKLIDVNKKYYDALVTRLYVDYEDKSMVVIRFDKVKQLWNKRDIVVIEGEKSRLGLENDLFNNANSVERIICPSNDAFSKYSEILSKAKNQEKNKLILIALGPTATVLAYDLAKEGYQAVDIGHIDIEYEWYLKGVTEKCPVKNKYIGEIDGGSDVEEVIDKKYNDEIIYSIV